MPSQALVCPSCQAPVTSGPNADGEYRCGYCGTPFHRHAAQSPPIVVNINQSGGGAGSTNGQPAALSTGLAIVGAMFILVAGAGLVSYLLIRGDADPPVAPEVSQLSAKPSPTGDGADDMPSAPKNPSVRVAPSKVAKAEAAAVASGTFELHTTLVGYQTSYYALGLVTNTSPFVIGHPKVNAILLDAEGNEVGTDFGFAEADTLGPNESSPIKILINDPPDHESVRYELVVKKASYIPKLVSGLRVEPTEPKAARYGKFRWELEGKVFNDGTEAAKFVSVEIQGLDSEGKIIGIDSAYADGDVLQPGASARFRTLSTTTAGPVDHFEFSVNGRPAD